MSVQSKVVGGCDALLIALIGALQLGVFSAFVAAPARREPVSIVTDQAHVEVIVVEAARFSRG